MTVTNLAVPATSAGWLSEQVFGILASLDFNVSACDLVLLDYSVNDADAKALYDGQRTRSLRTSSAR